jgi:hypothetical protein
LRQQTFAVMAQSRHACQHCQRQFRDHSIDRFDVQKWMTATLDANVLPDFILWMGNPVKWQPPPSDTKTL